ncbi:GTPase [Streptomyces sp. NPDC046887]|uniref:GTPase n=1 Tax=Streptomyces sp. NPDC046887 TaxID=3155472 RepID=UPI0033D0EAD5
MGKTTLGDAAARAVAESAPMVERLRTMTAELTGLLAPVERDGADPSGLLAEERALRERQVTALKELAGSRLEAMETFNVVLFGRTGAGKSTLVEALTGGDGARISTGDIDYTTTVDAFGWEGLRVYDTPGTNGWRAGGANRHLEEAARQAVLVADVVLLCFDTLHQLAGEFDKVAEWVLAYGKPAVAVLNVRARNWRDPAAVSFGDLRVQYSAKVAEHAAAIRESLGRHGLTRVPLVAVSAQRAAAARAADDYRGPDRETVELLRAHGRDALRRGGRDLPYHDSRELLLAWSNLPALEGLLAEAVTGGALDLRLGALTGRLTGALTEVAGELTRTLSDPARDFTVQHEQGLEELLTLLGRPPKAAPEASTGAGSVQDRALAGLREELAALERLRGASFEAADAGEVRGYLKHRLSARLVPLRTAAENLAEELVETAFRDRTELSEEEFARRVFPTKAIDTALGTAVEEFETHLRDRLSLTAADARADLEAVATRHVRVAGDAGGGLRRMGYWAAGAGAAGGVVGGVLSVAATTQFWNPVGWVAIGVMAASSIVYVGGRLLGRFGLGKAAREREAARVRSRQEARQAVRGYYDELHAQAIAHGEARLREVLLSAVAPQVTQALALRRITDDTDRLAGRLTREAAGLPETRDPATVLGEAVARTERDQGAAGPADRYWLGGSWCEDPYNLAEPASEQVLGGRSRATPRFTESLFGRLRSAFSAGDPVPASGSARRWLSLLHRELDGAPEATGLLAELDALAGDPRPRIVVAGATSSGKSAFIRRLLVESGLPVPDTLRSAAGPETRTVTAYEWEGFLLVDTPGFQSGIEPHTAAAVAALADAAAVFYLVGPDLLTGDRADLALLLRGDPESGCAAKADRVLFVVNKVDQLAADPRLGDVFRTAVARREDALRVYLGQYAPEEPGRARGPRHRIVSMAAAPYELRYDTARAYDDFRAWDGFRDFAAQVRALRSDLRRNAVDVTVLHGGLARLGALADAERRWEEQLGRRITRLGELAEEAEGGARTGRVLVAAALEDARQAARDFTARLVEEALAPDLDKPTRKVRGARIEHWSADPEFTARWEEIRTEAATAAEEWFSGVRTALKRRVTSQRFALAFPEGLPAVDISALDSLASGTGLAGAGAVGGGLLPDTAVAVGRLADVDPDALATTLGDHFGVLIGHDQAVHVLDTLAEGGAFLKILNSVSVIAKLLNEPERERQVEGARKVLLKTVRDSAETWATGVRGGLAAVEQVCGRLDDLGTRFTDEQNTALDQLAAVRGRRRAYEAAAADATARLRGAGPRPPAQRSAPPSGAPHSSSRKDPR